MKEEPNEEMETAKEEESEGEGELECEDTEVERVLGWVDSLSVLPPTAAEMENEVSEQSEGVEA